MAEGKGKKGEGEKEKGEKGKGKRKGGERGEQGRVVRIVLRVTWPPVIGSRLA